MTEVGRHPTLSELLQALGAICSIEAGTNALDSNSETFRVVLTFVRAQCPQDWRDGLPKPTWLIDGIFELLTAWQQQKIREAQWVSKEEQMGSSIDTLMSYWAEELKKSAAATPETLLTRFNKRTFSDTILRLNELKERRIAGGVYSATESRREKARKAWTEDEYEAPKREEAQRQKQYTDESERLWGDGLHGAYNKHFYKMYNDAFDKLFEDAIRGGGFQQKTNKPKGAGHKAWNEVLGVSASATESEIKKAHRKLVAKHQPRTIAQGEDRTRAEKMMEINTARDEGLKGL